MHCFCLLFFFYSSTLTGSSQHLKSKFGHGFQIDMTLTDANKVDGTRDFLRDNFAEAKEIEVCARSTDATKTQGSEMSRV